MLNLGALTGTGRATPIRPIYSALPKYSYKYLFITCSSGVQVVDCQSSQSEVGNFDDIMFADEDVGCSDVSMDVLLDFEIGHSICDLRSARRGTFKTVVRGRRIEFDFVKSDQSLRS